MNRVELIKKIYRGRLARVLRIASGAAVLLVAAALALELIPRLFAGDFLSVVFAAVTLGVPFILVSLLRRLLSLPRPCDLYDFGVGVTHGGGSFPSRHAYSSFAIGTYLSFLSLPLGIITLALAIVISASRVLLGLHFVRDVIAGALIGIFGAVFGALLFLF